MQASHLKKVIFFVFFSYTLPQVAYCQTSTSMLHKADSLFSIQHYEQAEKDFKGFQAQNGFLPTNGLLKMAQIEDQKNNFAERLYYLNSYYEKVLDKRVLKEMNVIAVQYNLKGYELSDFNFLILLYKQYSVYIFAGMFVLGIYIFIVLFFKRIKKQPSPMRHKIFLTIYLLGILFLINVPKNYYQQAITKRENVLLREDASAGSRVAGTLGKGHRMNVLGKSDIWYRVYWNEEILYLKAQDIWLIQ